MHPLQKNRFWKSGGEFSAKYHWAGLLALSVYVNSDIGLFTQWRFTEVRSKVCEISKVVSRAHARARAPSPQTRLWSFYLLMFIDDIWQSIRSSIRLSIIARGVEWIRVSDIRSRGQCALSLSLSPCVACAQFVARPASIRKWRQENRYDVLSLVIVWIHVVCTHNGMEREFLMNWMLVTTNDRRRRNVDSF